MLDEDKLDMVLLFVLLCLTLNILEQLILFLLLLLLLYLPLSLKDLHLLDVVQLLKSGPTDLSKIKSLHEIEVKVFSAILVLKQLYFLVRVTHLREDIVRLSNHNLCTTTGIVLAIILLYEVE